MNATKEVPNPKKIVNHLTHDVRRLHGLWSSLDSAAIALEAELGAGTAMGHLNAIRFLLDELAGLATALDEHVADVSALRDHIESLEPKATEEL